jgi:anti-sigma B factor antagonist
MREWPTMVPSTRKHVLLVEPDPRAFGDVERALKSVATLRICQTFQNAHAELFAHPPDLLVTNVCLEAYNGLHLVHLAAGSGLRTRSVAYTDRPDLGLARVVQAAKAFYESRVSMIVALPAYVAATLPQIDRRDVASNVRMTSATGGRRATDLVGFAAAASVIHRRRIGDVTILDVQGRLTEEDNASFLMRDELSALAHQGRTNVLLNLANVLYLGSAGLGAIVHGYTSLKRQGGMLKLVHVKGRVHETLTMTRLLGVFDVFDAEPEALASFALSST